MLLNSWIDLVVKFQGIYMKSSLQTLMDECIIVFIVYIHWYYLQM
jgi:hypothetical protein